MARTKPRKTVRSGVSRTQPSTQGPKTTTTKPKSIPKVSGKKRSSTIPKLKTLDRRYNGGGGSLPTPNSLDSDGGEEGDQDMQEEEEDEEEIWTGSGPYVYILSNPRCWGVSKDGLIVVLLLNGQIRRFTRPTSESQLS
jgi:hypothetical protein